MSVRQWKINKPLAVKYINAAIGVVKYRLGAKPALSVKPGYSGFKVSDCSGWVRWFLYATTPQDAKLLLLPGSWHQQEWCKKNLELCPYSDCGKLDGVIRIAFINPAGKVPGHVWLVSNGLTIESYGGRGVGRRAWNERVLLGGVNACYVLGTWQY